jgi:hypothetical protein
MIADDFIEIIILEIKGLSRYLEIEDYENALADAERECGWSTSVLTNFRIYWLKQRMKRHLFFYLMSESAHKFKYEQINLQHRFDHYFKLIEMMDGKFKEIMEEHPNEFLDVLGIDDVSGLFGTKVDAGFSYSPSGRDTTYDADNEVVFTPNESS